MEYESRAALVVPIFQVDVGSGAFSEGWSSTPVGWEARSWWAQRPGSKQWRRRCYLVRPPL